MKLTLRPTREQPDALDIPDERPLPGFVRVDLLPDRIRERQRIARVRRITAAALGGVVLLVVAGWWLANQDADHARADLAAAQAHRAQLSAEAAKYADVPVTFAAADAAVAARQAAMGGEVRWAFLLRQLTFTTPFGVQLDSINGQLADASAASNSPGGVLPMKQTVGTLTFTGTARQFPLVADWLDSLETVKDYSYPFLNSSTKDETSHRISWQSNADLSPEALSGRYGTPVATPTTTTPAPTTNGS